RGFADALRSWRAGKGGFVETTVATPPHRAASTALPQTTVAAGKRAPRRVSRRSCLILVAGALTPLFLVAGGFTVLKWRVDRVRALASSIQPGEYYGGIEIASSGVKATVIELLQDPKDASDYHVRLKT